MLQKLLLVGLLFLPSSSLAVSVTDGLGPATATSDAGPSVGSSAALQPNGGTNLQGSDAVTGGINLPSGDSSSLQSSAPSEQIRSLIVSEGDSHTPLPKNSVFDWGWWVFGVLATSVVALLSAEHQRTRVPKSA